MTFCRLSNEKGSPPQDIKLRPGGIPQSKPMTKLPTVKTQGVFITNAYLQDVGVLSASVWG
jgi:hypothetical protein